jgi:GT2 family glycosyltransferase
MSFNPKDLTVLFITYNRSDLLSISYQAIRNSRRLAGARVICSDDCSKAEHLDVTRGLGFDRVVTTERNGGLGRNNNKGLRAADTPYILMVQDDCKMVNDEAVCQAVQVLQADPSVGMVRLYGNPTYFPLIEKKAQGLSYWVADHTSQAYEEVKQGPIRHRVYSDQPHVRRRELHEKVLGFYAEGVPMEQTEMDYEDRMDAQRQLFVAYLNPVEVNHFVHLGAEASFRTSSLKHRMDRFVLGIVEKFGMRDSGAYVSMRAQYRKLQTTLARMGLLN